MYRYIYIYIYLYIYICIYMYIPTYQYLHIAYMRLSEDGWTIRLTQKLLTDTLSRNG